MELRGVTGADRERQIIERQVKHVVGLVDDLLDVSRITRGMVELRKETLELSDTVAKAIEMAAPAIEDRRHTLIVDAPTGLIVDGDGARLAQVFSNLLNNAAKYTDPGGTIRIGARRVDARLEVEVSDNGSGIAPDMLPHVFDLFAQERQSINRARGGLGIGLAIVRSLVQAHGGSVRAASAGRGSGASFIVALPAAASTQVSTTEAAAMTTVHVPGRRLLLVDDNEDAAALLAESLRRLGHEVIVTHDGPGALATVQTFHPDVALLDLGLPVMDGFELAERLRNDCGLHDLTLIAISGYARETDRRRTAEKGFHEHLAKPIDVRRLDAIIRRAPSESALS
jgi:CheY-like chemotaxis protein